MLFFADTYALIEYVQGGTAYKKYFIEHDIVTTKMNLLELYYWTLREDSVQKADEYYASFLPKTVEIDDDSIKKAAQFRFEHKNKNIPYVDAIGYETAKTKKIKFLTGDKAFKEMTNVEFVK